jgi:cytochrome P450
MRSIPGPFLARLTGAWVVILDLSGKRGATIHKLHQKYGHAVRIAPNQVSFASPQAVKDIYGATSKFTKAPIYDSLGFKSVFTTRNKDEYRGMKKRILPSFSQAAVDEMEPSVHRQIANLIKCFDKRVETPLDVLPWFRMLALGVVGE